MSFNEVGSLSCALVTLISLLVAGCNATDASESDDEAVPSETSRDEEALTGVVSRSACTYGGVQVWEDADKKGKSLTLCAPSPYSVPNDDCAVRKIADLSKVPTGRRDFFGNAETWNDRISSVEVFGGAGWDVGVEFYLNANSGGTRIWCGGGNGNSNTVCADTTPHSTVRDFDGNRFPRYNDRISSIEVYSPNCFQ